MTTPEQQEVESNGTTEDQAVQSMLSKWANRRATMALRMPRNRGRGEEAEAEQTDEVDAQADDDTEEEGDESGMAKSTLAGRNSRSRRAC